MDGITCSTAYSAVGGGADSLRNATGIASALTGTSTSSLLFNDAKSYMDFLILEMWHISATERPLLIQETYNCGIKL